MAPMIHESPVVEEVRVKSIATCSDPSVVPSESASKSLKQLWWLHGHPHSQRYSNPGLTSLGALVRHNGHVYGDLPGFLYPESSDPSSSFGKMTWIRFDIVTDAVAVLYASRLQKELSDANAAQKQPTVALLGTGTSIEYFCTEIALQKLGVRVLLLAETNAANALRHLLRTCNALAVITDSRNSAVDTNGIRKLQMCEDLTHDVDVRQSEVAAMKFQDFGDVWERHSFVLHSSGSTGLPKPVVHTNRSMMLIARMYRLFPAFEIKNWYLLFPLYHIAGISIALSGLPNGQMLSFPPLTWPPSSSSLLAAWQTLSSMNYAVDCVHCAPMFIENIYEHILEKDQDFRPLASLKVLQPGGAALSSTIIDALVDNGVNVKSTYGSTEIGPPFRSIPHGKSNPKCYSFRNLYPDNPYIEMQRVADGLYECVVHKGFELAANLWNTDTSDAPFRTNDLFIQDPPNSGNFILQGRKDDMLIHSNGENTKAGPLQLDIQSASKLIGKAVVFGHSRPCVSLLVEIDPRHDSNDVVETEKKVWASVREVNKRHPGQSRIMRSMIYILPPGQILPVTPKGNVKRNEAAQVYESIISQLYSQLESVPACSSTTPNSTTASPSSSSSNFPSSQSLADSLRALIADVADVPLSRITDSTTFYELGIDSRQALCLRASLSRRVGPISLGTIFERPSVASLTAFLQAKRAAGMERHTDSDVDAPRGAGPGSKRSVFDTTRRIISQLEAELESWPAQEEEEKEEEKEFSSRRTQYRRASRETILLTGGSGSLGTALLQALAGSPRVAKVYALIRDGNGSGSSNGGNNGGASAKLRASLLHRGMNADGIFASGNDGGSSGSSISKSKICVLGYDMRDARLGLDKHTYRCLADEVTTVMHNAWKMNFNQGVEEYEADCFLSTMSLLRLCLTGRPKTFAFTSSVSTCMGSAVDSLPASSPASFPSPSCPRKAQAAVPEAPVGPDPRSALPTGYAQSKYVVERVTQAASRPGRYSSISSRSGDGEEEEATKAATKKVRRTRRPGIRVKLLRVGQLCGDSRTGHWNGDEMWPIVFRSAAAREMRAVPVHEGGRGDGPMVDWVPVDVAGRAIAEVLTCGEAAQEEEQEGEGEEKDGEKEEAEGRAQGESGAGSETYTVYNVVNPRPVAWSELVRMLQKSSLARGKGRMEEVTWREWVARLARLAEEEPTSKVAGLRLLAFFEGMVAEGGREGGEDEEGREREEGGGHQLNGSRSFETRRTEGVSRALRECGQMCQEWIDGSVGKWRRDGILEEEEEEENTEAEEKD